MRLTNLNRSNGIGATCHHVELGPFRLVIDCGMDPKVTGRQTMPKLSMVPDHSLDFIILTHSHLDHLGALPVLLRRQDRARVLTSMPTRMLAPRMLYNSLGVMKRQREELEIPEYPLFTQSDIDRFNQRIMPLAYGHTREFELHGEALEVTLFSAGHVPGAAGVLLGYKKRSIFFTGDVQFEPQRILPGAAFPDKEVDTLVMETTRGATERKPGENRASETERFLETIRHTLNGGGSVCIPVFALGRMQEMLAILHEARARKELPECPIYSSGLGMDLCDIFDGIARKTGAVNFRRKLLKDLQVSSLPDWVKPGGTPPKPCIFLVSSGMMVENTPSYAVCAMLLGGHENTICIVGYCDPDTPGGKLLATSPGDEFIFEAIDHAARVSAHIERFDLSAHAERADLLDFALAASPRAIVLTHGDREARDWFWDSIYTTMSSVSVFDPEPLETCVV